MSLTDGVSHEFSEEQKKGVYRAIYERRDIRAEFLPRSIPEEVLMKLLDAAHHAGSVGFMQPWNFIVIQDPEIKKKVKDLFRKENLLASQNYSGDKKGKYLALKLEGILEAPINICVTCDHSRNGPHVLGRNTVPETDFFSVCCAIQNLWLAARCEGVGVGWVSILENGTLKEILHLPDGITPVAYLCLGYVSGFPPKPMLEQEGWEERLALEDLVFRDVWNNRDPLVLSPSE